jgi:hypothetical protein
MQTNRRQNTTITDETTKTTDYDKLSQSDGTGDRSAGEQQLLG